jgi:outer membrane protein
MKHLLTTSLLALMLASPIAMAQNAAPAAAPAAAVAVAPARIVLVSMETLIAQSTAGKAAFADLGNRINAFRTETQRQSTAFKTEEDALVKQRDVIDAAAFDQRVKAFQDKVNRTQQDLGRREQELNSIRSHIIQQIGVAINPLIKEEMEARGANIALERDSTLASSPSVDVTSAIMAKLNARKPSVSVTPLPQPAAAAAPAPATPPKK